MFAGIYLAVMLCVIAVVTALSVPSLFFKKCPRCGARNGLDAATCKRCDAAFPEEEWQEHE